MSDDTDPVAVARIAKEARLEERRLIEAGLDRRQKESHRHQIEVVKLQKK